jgi:uncharacterized protein (DUF488 family)
MDAIQTFTVWTVGHSTHTYEQFLSLLQNSAITALADVRSLPFSRRAPQFNRDELNNQLRNSGISYVFLGDQLGGRPRGRDLYSNGAADYEKIASTPSFGEGLARVLEGARRYRVAIMCAERDPLECHRCLLIGKGLAERGVGIKHILWSGSLLTQSEIEEQLLKMSSLSADELFDTRSERLAAAYRTQARKVAFVEP